MTKKQPAINKAIKMSPLLLYELPVFMSNPINQFFQVEKIRLFLIL